MRTPTDCTLLFLSHLASNDLHERIVTACRQIRRYAARGPGRAAGIFTFDEEIDALCTPLKQYRTAWRQEYASAWEIIYGRRFNLENHEGPAADSSELEWLYAPLLYFLKRYQPGCSLLETSLDGWFDGRKVQSYPNIIFRVYNGDKEPCHRCRVTLSHFYTRLGKNLLEWRHWEAFVNGFHPKLFRLAGIGRDELFADAGRLPAFFDKLLAVRNERTTSGFGGSQSDLIHSSGTVRKRQQTAQQKSDAYRIRIEPQRRRTDAEIAAIVFPNCKGFCSRNRHNRMIGIHRNGQLRWRGECNI